MSYTNTNTGQYVVQRIIYIYLYSALFSMQLPVHPTVNVGGSQPGVSAPLGVRSKSRGCQTRFPEVLQRIRNLVPRNVCRRFEFWSTTMGVSAINYIGLTEGYRARTKLGTPCLRSTTNRTNTFSIYIRALNSRASLLLFRSHSLEHHSSYIQYTTTCRGRCF